MKISKILIKIISYVNSNYTMETNEEFSYYLNKYMNSNFFGAKKIKKAFNELKHKEIIREHEDGAYMINKRDIK